MVDQFADHGAWGRHICGVSREEIIQAFLNIFKAVREQVREDFLILINTNRGKPTRYTKYVNGSFMLDLVHVANNFGKSTPDLNNDGVVNILDLTLVPQQFSQ